jgi:hypothetical protein
VIAKVNQRVHFSLNLARTFKMLRRVGSAVCTTGLRMLPSDQLLRQSIPTVFPQFMAVNRSFASKVHSFDEAKDRLGSLSEEPGPDIKLRLYGLFKQVRLYHQIHPLID